MEKRKRSTEGQENGAPAAKKQALEKTSGASASAAERRQLRSERKSKKGHQAKENARKKQKRSQTIDEPESFLPGQNGATGNDNIADGQDFVPLSDAADAAPTPHLNGDASVGRKEKKKPKPSPRSERKKGKGANATPVADEEPRTEEEIPEESKKAKDTTTRFICFVGNLPYTCTTSQIQHHFRKLEPTSIRHSTDKTTRKSKGFAFLEFDDYSKMKTCLKVYHHSTFDPERTARLPDDAFDENGLEKDVPGQNKKSTGRKINVELTAGGGGKGQGRKEKIQKKNTKLFEERERRKEAEGKQQKGKDRTMMAKHEKSEANATEIGSEAVHPSRMRRVKQ